MGLLVYWLSKKWFWKTWVAFGWKEATFTYFLTRHCFYSKAKWQPECKAELFNSPQWPCALVLFFILVLCMNTNSPCSDLATLVSYICGSSALCQCTLSCCFLTKAAMLPNGVSRSQYCSPSPIFDAPTGKQNQTNLCQQTFPCFLLKTVNICSIQLTTNQAHTCLIWQVTSLHIWEIGLTPLGCTPRCQMCQKQQHSNVLDGDTHFVNRVSPTTSKLKFFAVCQLLRGRQGNVSSTHIWQVHQTSKFFVSWIAVPDDKCGIKPENSDQKATLHSSPFGFSSVHCCFLESGKHFKIDQLGRVFITRSRVFLPAKQPDGKLGTHSLVGRRVGSCCTSQSWLRWVLFLVTCSLSFHTQPQTDIHNIV